MRHVDNMDGKETPRKFEYTRNHPLRIKGEIKPYITLSNGFIFGLGFGLGIIVLGVILFVIAFILGLGIMGNLI
jgi:hypothetical protein